MGTRQKRRNYLRRHYHVTFAHDEKLKALAEKTGINESEHVRRALDAYLFNDLYLFKKRRQTDQGIKETRKRKD